MHRYPRPLFAVLAVIPLVVFMPHRLGAQDRFEIEVYGYETAHRGAWELETHFNYTRLGTTAFDEGVAPTQQQLRLATELTRGLTDHWEASAYLLAAHRAGAGVEYAGWRLRSRIRAPETWRLPVNLGFTAEYEAARAGYSESPRTLEFTAILEKRIGRLTLNFNPAFERDLSGPASEEGWELEPKARVAVALSRVATLGIEYYGHVGHVGELAPAGEQVHQFFPSVDLHLGGDLTLNLGVGLGATSSGDRLVFKSRFEVPLGGERR